MRLLKPKRVGSYVRFQWLPKWTEDGDLVVLEFVRASYNGNDNGVVTIARLKPEREWNGDPQTIMEICGRRRAIGPTPCYYPDCDCTTEHEARLKRSSEIAARAAEVTARKRSEQERAEWWTQHFAEQDRWDNLNLARQGRSCEVNLFAPEYIRPPLVAIETNGTVTKVPRGPRPYHDGRFGPPRPSSPPNHAPVG